jgi:hypothetical protein
MTSDYGVWADAIQLKVESKGPIPKRALVPTPYPHDNNSPPTGGENIR